MGSAGGADMKVELNARSIYYLALTGLILPPIFIKTLDFTFGIIYDLTEADWAELRRHRE